MGHRMKFLKLMKNVQSEESTTTVRPLEDSASEVEEADVAPGVATSECRKGYTQIINKDFARSTDFEHQRTIPTLFIPIIDSMSKTVKLKNLV